MSPRTKPNYPAHLPAGLGMTAGERIDGAIELGDEDWLIVTPQALYVAHDNVTDVTAARFEYWQVAGAELDPATHQLTIFWAFDMPPTRVELPDSGDKTSRLLYQRVTSSMVTSQHRVVADHGFTVAIRRRPDGTLMSQLLPDPGADVTIPQVAQEAALVESALREACGLPPQTC